MTPFPLLSERLRLRPFRPTDLAAFAAYRDEPAVARYQSWTSYTLEEAEALYADMMSKEFGLPGEWYQIALAEKSSDRILGDLALHVIDERSVEIGFTLALAKQGHGFAREGVEALLRFIFEDFNHDTVVATTDARNAPSIRVLESAGFEKLAPERPTVFKNESIVELDFCLTVGRWRRQRA